MTLSEQKVQLWWRSVKNYGLLGMLPIVSDIGGTGCTDVCQFTFKDSDIGFHMTVFSCPGIYLQADVRASGGIHADSHDPVVRSEHYHELFIQPQGATYRQLSTIPENIGQKPENAADLDAISALSLLIAKVSGH